jgi:hypothetical protein
MRRFKLANKEVKNKMLFVSAQMPFVMLKRPFYFYLLLIIYVSTKEKNPEERERKSKCPWNALKDFCIFSQIILKKSFRNQLK